MSSSVPTDTSTKQLPHLRLKCRKTGRDRWSGSLLYISCLQRMSEITSLKSLQNDFLSMRWRRTITIDILKWMGKIQEASALHKNYRQLKIHSGRNSLHQESTPITYPVLNDHHWKHHTSHTQKKYIYVFMNIYAWTYVYVITMNKNGGHKLDREMGGLIGRFGGRKRRKTWCNCILISKKIKERHLRWLFKRW